MVNSKNDVKVAVPSALFVIRCRVGLGLGGGGRGRGYEGDDRGVTDSGEGPMDRGMEVNGWGDMDGGTWLGTEYRCGWRDV